MIKILKHCYIFVVAREPYFHSFFPKKKSSLLNIVKEILVSEKLLNKSFILKDVSLGNCVFETLLCCL